jgi:hypothetical protein
MPSNFIVDPVRNLVFELFRARYDRAETPPKDLVTLHNKRFGRFARNLVHWVKGPRYFPRVRLSPIKRHLTPMMLMENSVALVEHIVALNPYKRSI